MSPPGCLRSLSDVSRRIKRSFEVDSILQFCSDQLKSETSILYWSQFLPPSHSPCLGSHHNLQLIFLGDSHSGGGRSPGLGLDWTECQALGKLEKKSWEEWIKRNVLSCNTSEIQKVEREIRRRRKFWLIKLEVAFRPCWEPSSLWISQWCFRRWFWDAR